MKKTIISQWPLFVILMPVYLVLGIIIGIFFDWPAIAFGFPAGAVTGWAASMAWNGVGE